MQLAELLLALEVQVCLQYVLDSSFFFLVCRHIQTLVTMTAMSRAMSNPLVSAGSVIMSLALFDTFAILAHCWLSVSNPVLLWFMPPAETSTFLMVVSDVIVFVMHVGFVREKSRLTSEQSRRDSALAFP